MWTQAYDPLGSPVLSTALAALPVIVLLGLLGLRGWPAPRAAIAGLIVALVIAVWPYGMPVGMAASSALLGACYGLFPIGWIVFGAIFLYTLTVVTGQFEIVKASVAALSADRRIQAILIAFSFGAFIEGAAGFGTPVAISAALLIGAGFPPLYAAGLSLIANTAPVAFGALGTPITMLAKVTGLPEMQLSAMAGRQLPLFSLMIPAWMVVTMSGWRGLRGVWPAVLVSGGSFALVQFAVANWLGPTLVDVAGGVVSLVLLALFMKVWQPRDHWQFAEEDLEGATLAASAENTAAPIQRYSRREIARAWTPWVLLSLCMFVWGLPQVRTFLDGGLSGSDLNKAIAKLGDGATVGSLPWHQRPNALAGISSRIIEVGTLHKLVVRGPEVTKQKTADAKPEGEEAVFKLNWLSATGTGILFAAILSAAWLSISPKRFCGTFALVMYQVRWPLCTIAAMMAIAFVTRYSGTDVTLGLAFTHTGILYPFFAPLLGWLGVALTGSDTASNALFGNLQAFTANHLGLNPVLICTSNSTGGVMGKMIDAQSIVVAAVATGQANNEGRILRFVFWHSIALAALMGLLTLAQAYWLPQMVP